MISFCGRTAVGIFVRLAAGAFALAIFAPVSEGAPHPSPELVDVAEVGEILHEKVAQSWRGKNIKNKFNRAAKNKAKKGIKKPFKKAAEGDDDGDEGDPPPVPVPRPKGPTWKPPSP